MGVDSPDRVNSQTGAVFLSYASEDAPAAQRIAEVLRSARIEVWFDREELRGAPYRSTSVDLNANLSVDQHRTAGYLHRESLCTLPPFRAPPAHFG